MGDEDSTSQHDREMDTWFLGDQLLWSKYLPRAWRAVAGTHNGETFPSWINLDQSPRWQTKAHGIFGAYLHLLLFRLGWVNPGLGLLRWHELGRPPLDPVLEFIGRLGGDGLDWFVGWAAVNAGQPVPDELKSRFPNELGGDELHISMHCSAPGLASPWPWGLNPRSDLPNAYRYAEGALVSDDYTGWWNVLALLPEADFESGIDVVVKPIGWMGCYRRSARTRVPHATSHDVHALGVDPESLGHFAERIEQLRSRHDRDAIDLATLAPSPSLRRTEGEDGHARAVALRTQFEALRSWSPAAEFDSVECAEVSLTMLRLAREMRSVAVDLAESHPADAIDLLVDALTLERDMPVHGLMTLRVVSDSDDPQNQEWLLSMHLAGQNAGYRGPTWLGLRLYDLPWVARGFVRDRQCPDGPEELRAWLKDRIDEPANPPDGTGEPFPFPDGRGT